MDWMSSQSISPAGMSILIPPLLDIPISIFFPVLSAVALINSSMNQSYSSHSGFFLTITLVE